MKFNFQSDMGICRLCGATRDQRTFGREKYLGAGQSLRRCGYCGGVYLAPDPSPETIDKFYKDEYRKLYLGEVPFWSDELFFRHRLDQEYAQERRKYIAEELPHGARVFELGSGYGTFLSELSDNRPDLYLYSSEPDVANRNKRLRNAKVTFIDVTDISTQGPFDIICAFHVFEHLVDPMEILSKLVSSLIPGSGKIIIEVPDVMSDWGNWKYIHPAHLIYYSSSSLSKLLIRSGLILDYVGQHPHGSMFAGTLLGVGVAPDSPINPIPSIANAEEIEQLDLHISQYGWTKKDVFLNLTKKILVQIGMGGMIGFLQRWSFYKRMKREFNGISEVL